MGGVGVQGLQGDDVTHRLLAPVTGTTTATCPCASGGSGSRPHLHTIWISGVEVRVKLA